MIKKDFFRAFFAIQLPEEIRQRISDFMGEIKQISGFTNIRWVKAEHLHITLRFLGNVGSKESDEIVARVTEELKNVESFAVKFSSLVLFPSPQKPRVIALKPEPLTNLIKLNQIIEKVVTKYDVKIEKRAFVPHLTLGRIRHSSKVELPQVEVPAMRFKADSVKLYRSDPAEHGSVYTLLTPIGLRG